MALTKKLKAIADAIREKTGSTSLLTLDEMAEMIPYLGPSTNAYILMDLDGNEVPAVITDEEVELTATTNDIRIGTTAVTDEGVVTGEKEIPAYYVSEGVRLVTSGGSFAVQTNQWDYTKLQAVFCKFNSNLSDSVYTDKVAINDTVYSVLSTDALSTISKDAANSRVEFGITNDTDTRYLIRYFMYKEEY